MKNIVLVLMALIAFASCDKTTVTPKKGNTIIIPPNTNPTDTPKTMVNTKWVINSYRVGTMGTPITISDTLNFTTIKNYTYNNVPYTYSFYVTGSVYNLTLNYTPWGNLSGSVNDNNLTTGLIQGTKFVDISMGSSGTTEYYLWMKKIQ